MAKKYFNVSFQMEQDGFYHSNIAHAETVEDVKEHYSKYHQIVAITEASEGDIQEAQRKGKPIVEVNHIEPKSEEPTSEGYAIATNPQFNSLEISFNEKPSENIRTALKGLGFRWNPKKSIWYGFASPEEVAAALGTESAPQTKPSKADQNHIRIYYNGLKVDGGDLVRCFYFKDGDKINITARDYDRLPSDLFEVHNDTDLYTDYFCEDSATLTPEHPLYKYVFYAYKKSAAKDSQRHIDYINKRIAKGVKFDFYKDDLERANKSIEEFKSMTDPGQPTAADLARYKSFLHPARNEMDSAVERDN